MSTTRTRLLLVIGVLLVLYSIIAMRLFYWQVVRGAELKQIGQNQSSDSLILQATRGEILSSDNFPLATNRSSYWLYANPKVVEEKLSLAKTLAPFVERDEASIAALLDQDLFWVGLARNLPSTTKLEIEKLQIKGIGFQKESIRMYPEASLAAQLVGFLGKDIHDNPRGYFGVEGYYNEQLQGRSGRLYVVKDALGNPVINDIREEKKIDGRDVQLTVDRTIQFITERKLLEGVEKYGAEGGTAIVMEPSTGKILAMASFPRFDPQAYWEFDHGNYVNPAISGLFEPGSTFKVLVMASGIDAGVVKPDTTCDICDGPVKIDGYTIKTWNNEYFANSSMTDVIQHSDNIGMVYVARKLGLDRMTEYFDKFGIGDVTGIDLQGEVSASIREKDNWHTIDLATASFGQGISVTPLQLLNGVNAIANGGKIMKPYIVQKIMTDTGDTITIQPEIKKTPISETTSEVMTWIMVNAVEKGESKWTKVEGLRVAGKTGTAQIPVAGHYDPNKTNASFVGFYPADDPKISMLIIINKPQSSIYGSETAAPVFFNITRDIVNYLNIPLTY